MANPIVIDISHWQPEPNFSQVKEGGTIGVILKATEGTSYVDPTLKGRAASAMRAGLLISTYHFLRPGNYEQQMAHFLKTVNPVQGERLCLDHEDTGVSLAALKDCVEILLNDPRKLQVTIYSGHVIKEQLGSKEDEYLAENTSLWIAQYTSAAAPSWPKQVWPAWSLWQYSQTEKVSGISGNVDGNKWNGTEEALIKWLSPAGSVTPVPPEPVAKEVLVAITQPDGVKITVTVNGEIVGR